MTTHPYDFPAISMLPFGLLLGAIAVLPLTAPHWWEHNRNRALVAGLCAAPIAILLALVSPHALLHSLEDYASFLIILIALYTISGGIVIGGGRLATPWINAGFLGFGVVAANVIGTTGASMLLLRPILRANRERRFIGHLPFFFILMVSNAGGLLTPLGDPPLFLGYLRGVPFFWTLRMLPIWLISNAYLLAVFLVFDVRAARREAQEEDVPAEILRREQEIEAAIAPSRSNPETRALPAKLEPLHIEGRRNIVLLLVVAASALLPSPYREIVMLACAVISYLLTPREHHHLNDFTFGPVAEVAIFFAGIFITMVPALEILRGFGGGPGLGRPWHYFWLTGGLSSVLDNAPTYLTFLSLAQGAGGGGPVVGISHTVLGAISAGAVLMGANTYIGNGPNFMVKAMAEQRGIPLPSFFGFAARALLVLVPLYLLLTILFFR